MRESQNIPNKIIGLISFAIILIFIHSNLSLARTPKIINITIESKWHVCPPHTMKDLIFLPLKLTYHIPSTHIPSTNRDKAITISIPPGAGGLVVEHIARDGTRATQSVPPESWWLSQAETVEIKSSTLSMYFDVWVLPGVNFDFSALGIYHISYVHPWVEPEEDPNSLIFRSNILTIMCVSQQRFDHLHKMLRENLELAFASYRFKNPLSAIEMPKYRRSVPSVIDEAIKKGTRQDEVLWLLGSPDIAGHTTIGEQKTYGWDEEWIYETGPASGYIIHFKNGHVVRKGYHADWSGEEK